MNCIIKYIILFFALFNSRQLIAFHEQIERQVIINPFYNDEEIEFYIQKPASPSACPVIFLLHGYQPRENSPGGAQLVEYGYLQRFVKEGIIAIAISIPGYGKSTGKRDFGGIDSQQAIGAVIEYVKDLPFVDSSKMGIYGISRGAQLAGMVTCLIPSLRLQILESGFYDLFSFQSETPEYLDSIRNSILHEAGNTEEGFISRSILYHADKIKASTLILQGEFDDRRQLPAAQKLHDKLIKRGLASTLKIFPKELHALPADKWDTIMPFVRELFFELYGIGIKVSEATPAIQVLKIYPDSPAFNKGIIQEGDAILSISPNDDDSEISVLNMPIPQFVSLVLGKNNTALRLRIQHFDLSIEEVVVSRG